MKATQPDKRRRARSRLGRQAAGQRFGATGGRRAAGARAACRRGVRRWDRDRPRPRPVAALRFRRRRQPTSRRPAPGDVLAWRSAPRPGSPSVPPTISTAPPSRRLTALRKALTGERERLGEGIAAARTAIARDRDDRGGAGRQGRRRDLRRPPRAARRRSPARARAAGDRRRRHRRARPGSTPPRGRRALSRARRRRSCASVPPTCSTSAAGSLKP